MPRIFIDMPLLPEGLSKLQALPRVSLHTVEPSEEARDFPAELLRYQQILFCTMPPRNLEDASSLEWIQISTAGYGQLLDRGLLERKTRACNARGVFETTIAEWNILMMIALARDLRGMIRNQERGIWDRAAPFQGEIRGKVVGFWGYGGLARETARLAKGMGLTIHVFARHGARLRENTYLVPGTGDPEAKLPDRIFSAGEELEFLAGLDFLVVAMPLTPLSQG